MFLYLLIQALDLQKVRHLMSYDNAKEINFSIHLIHLSYFIKNYYLYGFAILISLCYSIFIIS